MKHARGTWRIKCYKNTMGERCGVHGVKLAGFKHLALGSLDVEACVLSHCCRTSDHELSDVFDVGGNVLGDDGVDIVGSGKVGYWFSAPKSNMDNMASRARGGGKILGRIDTVCCPAQVRELVELRAVVVSDFNDYTCGWPSGFLCNFLRKPFEIVNRRATGATRVKIMLEQQ